MIVRRVELTDVRAWSQLGIDIEGSTVFLGGNGTGKTTIIESLYYAATLKSHRTSTDQALIRRGAERAAIRVQVERPRLETIELELAARGRSRAQLGGAPVSSRREILGILRVSLFAPERVEIIRGDPGERRSFADELLTMLSPRLHATLRDYDKTLRQRNRLLRSFVDGEGTLEGLDAWDASLLQLAAQICDARSRAIVRLTPLAAAAFELVAGGEFDIAYAPRCEHPGEGAAIEDWHRVLTDKLEERRELERIRGTSLVGPHRDEVDIQIDQLPARTHASHGEGWLAALALSLASQELIAQVSGQPPVLLLDDPFTLLDPSRRVKLVDALPEGQVLVTAADPAEVPDSFPATRVQVASQKAS